jgi:formylglycine-generating enzyme required for sulfatase activity
MGICCTRRNAVGVFMGRRDWQGQRQLLGLRQRLGPETRPVGSFAPNAFGLYDMHGNVWEWVEDCNNNSYDGAPTDGSAWTVDIMGPQGGSCVFRVNRGGAFNNDFRGLRSASRSFNSPESSWQNVGFRVGRTLSARVGAVMVAPGEHH